jgi:serine/threonine-protein phosphatase 2B catalytic subunit
MYVPTDEQFWSKEDPTKPDIAFLKNHFYREGRLTEEQALYILSKWVPSTYTVIKADE